MNTDPDSITALIARFNSPMEARGFVTPAEVDALLLVKGEYFVRQNYWRHRISPGWNVADHIDITKFFSAIPTSYLIPAGGPDYAEVREIRKAKRHKMAFAA